LYAGRGARNRQLQGRSGEPAALLIAHARPSTGILSHHDGGDARENTEEIGREKNGDKNHTVTSEQRKMIGRYYRAIWYFHILLFFVIVFSLLSIYF
jgi:hypothetical protein